MRKTTNPLANRLGSGMPPVLWSGTKTERHAVALDRPIQMVNEMFRGLGWSRGSSVSLDCCPLHWLPAGKTMRQAGGGRRAGLLLRLQEAFKSSPRGFCVITVVSKRATLGNGASLVDAVCTDPQDATMHV